MIATGRPLGGVHSTHLMEWQGIKVGLVGLAEQDWIATLATVNPSDVDYLEFRAEGTRLAALLRVLALSIKASGCMHRQLMAG